MFADIDKDLVASIEFSSYKEAILGYIAGCIVRKMSKKITCNPCFTSLRCNDHSIIHDHGYSYSYATVTRAVSLSLISSKDRGGLVTPSASVIGVVRIAEKFVKVALLKPRKINKKALAHSIFVESSSKRFFKDLDQHDIQNEAVVEDLHSTQIMKTIIDYHLKIRLHFHAVQYNKDELHKDTIGKRQQVEKMLTFKGI